MNGPAAQCVSLFSGMEALLERQRAAPRWRHRRRTKTDTAGL